MGGITSLGVNVNKDSGIIGPKLILNTLHRNLAENGYNEVRNNNNRLMNSLVIISNILVLG